METPEQRDEVHVEQHGSGDVHIEQPSEPEPDQGEGQQEGDEQEGAEPEGG